MENIIEMKFCPHCGQEKEMTKFRKYRTKNGIKYQNICGACRDRIFRDKQHQKKIGNKLNEFTTEELLAEIERRKKI